MKKIGDEFCFREKIYGYSAKFHKTIPTDLDQIIKEHILIPIHTIYRVIDINKEFALILKIEKGNAYDSLSYLVSTEYIKDLV
jgi:hypothetical protein